MSVPETWQLVRLSNVCAINPPLSMEERLDPDTPVSFIPMAAVDEIEAKIARRETRTFQEVSKGFTPFRENDVLFAKITPSMENGKAAIATDLENGLGFGSTEFHVLRPTDHLSPDYLLYFIRQPWFRNYARTAFVGSAGQQRVPQDFLERVQLPLPTLPEQQHIVAILQRAEELRRLRREGLETAKQLTKALFLETFGDPATNPNGWPVMPFGKFVTYSKYGPRFPDREYAGSGARILRTTDMTGDGLIRWWESPILPLSPEELEEHTLKPRTLLVSRSGTIGPIAIFEGAAEPCVAGAYLIEFGLSDDIVTEYVKEFFLSDFGQRMLKTGSRSATQANLNAPTIKRIPIPIPDITKQSDFAAKIKEIRIRLDQQLAAVQDMNRLNDSFTSESFSGNLTAIWRASHLRDLEIAARARDAALGQANGRTVITEYAPPVHREVPQPERYWLTNHLGEVQGIIWEALQEWSGTLIPSEDLDAFRQSAPRMEQIEDANDHILRALSQLAGLGFIAQVSVPNQQGEYVTGYRGLGEGEHLLSADLQLAVESQR